MRPRLTRGWKAVLSGVVAFHVTAVFLGPWSMAPYGSALSETLAAWVYPYLVALSLNNGYRFFAPEPGPSHLIRYELTLADGRKVRGVFPDLAEQRPRLLYHRHFMLSEFVNSRDSPEFENPALDLEPVPEELAAVAAAREQVRELIRSYARHLARRHGAVRVELVLRRHNIPWPEDVQAGVALDDPRWFQEKLLGTFEGTDLE